jgi:hypothetical protein
MLSNIVYFFSTYWPVILVLVIAAVLFAVIHAVRRVLKEGGGAFNLATIRKSSEPNKEGIKEKSQAILKDADMICDVKNERVIPHKEDLLVFRAAIKSRYKVAMFLVEKENKVAYFFCKSEAGLRRRVENLLPNSRHGNSHWPYADKETGEKLRFPRV